MNPRYPIYIISKGRWESRLTSKALEKMQVPYRIVIEPQEYFEYSSVIDPDKILQLPFSNLGKGYEFCCADRCKICWMAEKNQPFSLVIA